MAECNGASVTEESLERMDVSEAAYRTLAEKEINLSPCKVAFSAVDINFI